MTISRGLPEIIKDVIPKELFDNYTVGEIKWNSTNAYLFIYSINNSATALTLIECLKLREHATPLKALLIKTASGLYVITLGRNLPDLKNKLEQLSAVDKEALTNKIKSEFITQSHARVKKLAGQVRAELPSDMDLQSVIAQAYAAVSYKISPPPTTVDEALDLNIKMDALADAYRDYYATQVNLISAPKPSMM